MFVIIGDHVDSVGVNDLNHYELQVNYIMTFALNMSNESAREEIIANYTNYLTEEESLYDVESFMKSIDDSVKRIELKKIRKYYERNS